jgi:hypothetical protein
MTTKSLDHVVQGAVNVGEFFTISPVSHYFPDSIPSDLVAQITTQDSVSLLMTTPMKLILDQVRDGGNWTNPACAYGGVLKGIGGAGKSTIMFAAVALARHTGHIVVYVVDNVTSPITLSQKLLLAHRPQLPNDSVAAIEAMRTNDQNAVQGLMTILSSPGLRSLGVLVAIDEWNSFFDPKSLTLQPLFPEYTKLLQNFSGLRGGHLNGFVLFAVSSSFEPIAKVAFSDGDAQLKQIVISAFSEKDATVYVQTKQACGDISPKLALNEILQLTGRVPRLIAFLERGVVTLHVDCDYNTLSAEEILNLWRTLATNYYKQRVYAVLQKRNDGTVRNHVLATMLYKNEPICSADMTPVWESSGLFAKEPTVQTWTPACEVAKQAVFEFMTDCLSDTVAILKSDVTVKWRAFELMFVEHFRRHSGGAINVYPAKSDWATQPSTEILVRCVIEQNQKTDEIPDVPGAPSGTIPPGTMVVCRKDYPCIDFFIHSASGHKFFVQLSETPYEMHKGKAENVFKKDLTHFKRPAGMNMFTFFYTKANNGKKCRYSAQFPSDAFYVYVCTKTFAECFGSSASREGLLFASREVIDPNWGSKWGLFFS